MQSQFIQIEETKDDGRVIAHILNVAHIVHVNSNTGYTPFLTLATGAQIWLDSVALATVRRALALLMMNEAGEIRASSTCSTHETQPEERCAYCDTRGADREAYIRTQREMFATLRECGVDTNDRETRIAAVTDALHIDITSFTQLTPAEMQTITQMARAGQLQQAQSRA